MKSERLISEIMCTFTLEELARALEDRGFSVSESESARELAEALVLDLEAERLERREDYYR